MESQDKTQKKDQRPSELKINPSERFQYLDKDPAKDSIIKHIQECKQRQASEEEASSYIQMIESRDRLKMLTGSILLRKLSSKSAKFFEIFDGLNQGREVDLIDSFRSLIVASKDEYLRSNLLKIMIKSFGKHEKRRKEASEKGLLKFFVHHLRQNVWGLAVIDRLLSGMSKLMHKSVNSQDQDVNLYTIEIVKNVLKRVYREEDPPHPLVYRLIFITTGYLVLEYFNDLEELKFIKPACVKVLKSLVEKKYLLKYQFGADSAVNCLYMVEVLFTVEELHDLQIGSDFLELLDIKAHKESEEDIQLNSLIALKKMVKAKGQICASLVENGIIEKIYTILKFSSYEDTRDQACYLLSKIGLAGSQEVQAILSHKALLKLLMEISTEDVLDMRREAIRTLTNLTEHTTDEQLAFLIQENVLELYYNVLKRNDDPTIVRFTLDSIVKIIQQGSKMMGIVEGTYNPLCAKIDRIGLKDLMVELAEGLTEKMKNFVMNNMLTYFSFEA